jgi:hypothetical protein
MRQWLAMANIGIYLANKAKAYQLFSQPSISESLAAVLMAGSMAFSLYVKYRWLAA